MNLAYITEIEIAEWLRATPVNVGVAFAAILLTLSSLAMFFDWLMGRLRK